MLYWIPYAFVRISVFFIAGILLGIYVPNLLPLPIAATLLGVIVGCYFALHFFNHRFPHHRINLGFTGLLAILIAGYTNVALNTPNLQSGNIVHVNEPILYYKGVVGPYGEEKKNTYKCVLSVEEVKTSKGWFKVNGKVLLLLSKDKFDAAFQYGDVLLLKGSPRETEAPSNPNEFDYKRYLFFKKITHQHFLEAHELYKIDNKQGSRLLAISIDIRTWADAKIKEAIRGKDEQAIASALLLGVTDSLDNSILSAYAATGAMHVLSVSGLHVGILYLVILFLLKPLSKIRNGLWISTALAIIVLWLYAYVTGLSPSVLRAVTMFSFLAIAKPFGYRANIYNTLAVSAFCLLLVDPFMIMSVGFQLSYIAVVGIVYLYPRIYAMLYFPNKLFDQLWMWSCVSIAAQIATAPLALFYFNQFPSYFLLANIFVVPLGFLILVGGLALLVSSFVEGVYLLLGTCLEWTIWLLNQILLGIESLPFSVARGIYITPLQCLFMMLAIVFVLLAIHYRKIFYMGCVALLIIGVGLESWRHYIYEAKPTRLTVYEVSGYSAIDVINAGYVYSLGDSVASDKLNFHILPNRVKRGVETIQVFDTLASHRFLFGEMTAVNGKTILHLKTCPQAFSSPLVADYLIVGKEACKDFDKVLKVVEAKNVILDSSVPWIVAHRIVNAPGLGDRHIHSTIHKGAFDQIL